MGGDCVKNTIHKLTSIFRVGLHGQVRRGGGSKYVKNGSNGLKLFVDNFVSYSGKFFSFDNNVFVRAYVEDTADSMQTFPSQKLWFQLNRFI